MDWAPDLLVLIQKWFWWGGNVLKTSIYQSLAGEKYFLQNCFEEILHARQMVVKLTNIGYHHAHCDFLKNS